MAKEKAKPLGEVDPRMILPGHIIQPRDSEEPEVVRSISVVVHLANGHDEHYEINDRIKIMPPAELPTQLPDNLKPVEPPVGE